MKKFLPIILVLTLAACGGGSGGGNVGNSGNADDCGRRIPTEYVVKDTPLAGGVQNESVYFNTEFYGDDNIPAEAVALFQYQQKVMDTPKEGGGNLNIFLGFGGRTK